MLANYIKDAFNILQEDGPVSLVNSALGFIKHQKKLSRKQFRFRKNLIISKIRYDAPASPFTITTISPDKITKYLTDYDWYKQNRGNGLVKGGRWDIEKTIPIEEYPHLRGFKEHFCQDIPWRKTIVVDRYVNRSDLPKYGCETKEELRNHYSNYYEKYDELYDEIQKNGFQMIERSSKLDPRQYYAITVHIGRNGEYIFRGQGHHRLAIAKILQLDEIPVRIYLRHKHWQELRDEIHNNGLPEESEDLRDHPDLQDIIDE